jgi:crossover junction endodeoxyribonuclease RuvC
MSHPSSPPDSVILGIDPGFDRCGYAVVRSHHSTQSLQLLVADCIQTDRRATKLDRFHQIYDQLELIWQQFPLQAVAMESLYFSRNVSTALPVSEVRGLIAGLGFSHQVPIFEYTPAQVKIAVTGYGRADKKQIQHMLCQLLRLETIPKLDDTSDAIGVALTHAVSTRYPTAHV